MKVIKRDGRAVDFNRDKIAIAIEKANVEVKPKDKATKKEIEQIIEYIEELDKKRILVEDIQDIIEQKLMEINRYNLAKKYIVYRYTRALVRKQNTTDDSILGLIKNSNRTTIQGETKQGIITAPMQRDLIAGEVSKDLTRRILLPEKITKANDEEIIYFHNAEYFLQPIINTSVINIEDMLDNGTAINGIVIDTPKSFQIACTVMAQIILAVSCSQYGKQYMSVNALGKYLKNSQELSRGIQTLLWQINTFITPNGKPPQIALLINIDENDKYKKENEMIVEEIIRQTNQGIKNENNEYKKMEIPELITDSKEIRKILEHKFDQGKVSVNLVQIAKIAKKDYNAFWNLLNERLDLCYEALMYRHYALLGTLADISPIHWQNGGIARLAYGENINKLLKGGSSTLTLGCKGLKEVIQLMEDSDDKENVAFEKNIIKLLKDKLHQWKKETGIDFVMLT